MNTFDNIMMDRVWLSSKDTPYNNFHGDCLVQTQDNAYYVCYWDNTIFCTSDDSIPILSSNIKRWCYLDFGDEKDEY